jgi:hypothetical protein
VWCVSCVGFCSLPAIYAFMSRLENNACCSRAWGRGKTALGTKGLTQGNFWNFLSSGDSFLCLVLVEKANSGSSRFWISQRHQQLLLVVWLILQSEKSTLILISITEIAQTESLHGMHWGTVKLVHLLCWKSESNIYVFFLRHLYFRTHCCYVGLFYYQLSRWSWDA